MNLELKKLSPAHIVRTRVEAAKEARNFREFVARMESVLDPILQRSFPNEFSNFHKPSRDRMAHTYLIAAGGEGRPLRRALLDPYRALFDITPQKVKALHLASIIRYVDDFIDQAVWPKIEVYGPLTVRRTLDQCLDDIIHVSKGQLDVELPSALKRLPILELEFELSSRGSRAEAQTFFDANVRALFECKSYDIHLVAERAGISPPLSLWSEGVSILDTLRDFSTKDHRNASDFNLFLYIQKTGIDPKVCIDYLRDFLERESHAKGEDKKTLVRYKGRGVWDDRRTIQKVISKLETMRPKPSVGVGAIERPSS